MRESLSSERGVTLFEVALLLIATMAIVAVLTPSVSATLRDARATRAATDMAAIRDAINNFKGNGFTRFTNDGTNLAVNSIELLVSNGDIPNAGTASNWRSTTSSDVVDFLEEHLVLNSFNAGISYPLSGGRIWRGAYLNAPIDPDPWGNRYAVNVAYLGAPNDDVVVHSAGPDEAVDTSDTGNPLVAGGDDLILLVES